MTRADCPPGPAARAASSATSPRARGAGRRPRSAPGTTPGSGTACRSRSRRARRAARTRPEASSIGPVDEDGVTTRAPDDPVARTARRGQLWPATEDVRRTTSIPAAAQRLATSCACSSEPPASGSSTSRQARMATRRSPAPRASSERSLVAACSPCDGDDPRWLGQPAPHRSVLMVGRAAPAADRPVVGPGSSPPDLAAPGRLPTCSSW